MLRLSVRCECEEARWDNGALLMLVALGLLSGCDAAVSAPSAVAEPSTGSRAEAGSSRSQLPASAVKPPVAAVSATSAAATAPCRTMCSHARELGCTGLSHCSESCAELLAAPECKAQLDVALGCMVREPREHWTCNEDGLASIRDGYCNAEQGAYIECLRRGGV